MGADMLRRKRENLWGLLAMLFFSLLYCIMDWLISFACHVNNFYLGTISVLSILEQLNWFPMEVVIFTKYYKNYYCFHLKTKSHCRPTWSSSQAEILNWGTCYSFDTLLSRFSAGSKGYSCIVRRGLEPTLKDPLIWNFGGRPTLDFVQLEDSLERGKKQGALLGWSPRPYRF
jgi:hypothetical protein